MKFHNEESAQQAFSKAGLSSSATIVDDEGTVHEGVDTFYGCADNDQQDQNRFELLINQIFRSTSG